MTSDELQRLYQQLILDHAKQRHGATPGALPPLESARLATAGLTFAESYQVNTTCGDEVTVRLSVDSDARTIAAVEWAGEGCSISMAAASVLTDQAGGLTVEEARAVLDAYRAMLHSRGTLEPDEEILGDAAAFAGVSRYPARIKCAMLPWLAFEAALLTAEAR